MKAAVVTDFDAPPRYGSFDDPVEDAEHRVVTVRAAAVHRIVRSRAAGLHYSSGGRLPMVPGIDCMALTDEGQRIYTGAAREPYGTLAERASVARGLAVPVPDELADDLAAALPNSACSSWVPLAPLLGERPGQTVLIHGATGASGLMAVQVARPLGAGRVVAAGRSASGLRASLDRGADATIDLSRPLGDQLGQAAPEGIDVIVDYLWGERTRDLPLALLPQRRDAGRPLDLIEVGSMAGAELLLDAAWLRSRPLRVRGSGLGSVGRAGADPVRLSAR